MPRKYYAGPVIYSDERLAIRAEPNQPCDLTRLIQHTPIRRHSVDSSHPAGGWWEIAGDNTFVVTACAITSLVTACAITSPDIKVAFEVKRDLRDDIVVCGPWMGTPNGALPKAFIVPVRMGFRIVAYNLSIHTLDAVVYLRTRIGSIQ